LHVKVASDYQGNAPLRVAVLPFTDRGSANFVVDKIPLTYATSSSAPAGLDRRATLAPFDGRLSLRA